MTWRNEALFKSRCISIPFSSHSMVKPVLPMDRLFSVFVLQDIFIVYVKRNKCTGNELISTCIKYIFFSRIFSFGNLSILIIYWEYKTHYKMLILLWFIFLLTYEITIVIFRFEWIYNLHTMHEIWSNIPVSHNEIKYRVKLALMQEMHLDAR